MILLPSVNKIFTVDSHRSKVRPLMTASEIPPLIPSYLNVSLLAFFQILETSLKSLPLSPNEIKKKEVHLCIFIGFLFDFFFGRLSRKEIEWKSDGHKMIFDTFGNGSVFRSSLTKTVV